MFTATYFLDQKLHTLTYNDYPLMLKKLYKLQSEGAIQIKVFKNGKRM